MVTVTVVEPNALLRLGILNLLETLDCETITVGVDYVQLFQGAQRHLAGTDLLLLSVPDAYERMIELLAAAQQHYEPRRILFLSDTHVLPYSLLKLPATLAGYVCKHASQDVLKTSVMLVLAGGKCFPAPETLQLKETEPGIAGDGRALKRRWYEKDTTLPDTRDALQQPDNLLQLRPTGHAQAPTPAHAPRPPLAQAKGAAPEASPLSPRATALEAELLGLTPRQYEVLALMAKGYPLKKISRELNISVATAKTHTEALYQRLSVNNRNAAVYAAISRGATLGWAGSAVEAAGSPHISA
ncbi:response regulator transcription factor [Castellaniella caeni]|uniref:response regulator transcription factor n=1 Tax=Castellaniella caeni TaxID=266123 RepID=UPI00082CBD9A|nr:LuxR C-terminal-related transcriptional regulator [Castellaniella caeni]